MAIAATLETGDLSSPPETSERAATDGFRKNNFDLVRLFAAMQVMLFHGLWYLHLPSPAYLAPLGWFPGVPIFFVISGFLISKSLDRSPDLLAYAKKRALRILPGLWAILLVTVVVASAFGFSFLSRSALVWLPLQFVGVIYTPHFLDAFGFGSYNGSLWTIPIELQFYAMLPLIYALIGSSRDRNRILLALFLGFLALAILFAFTIPEMATAGESRAVKLLRYTFVPRFYLFLLGVVLQRYRVYAHPAIHGRGLFWLAGYSVFRLVVPQVQGVYIADEMVMALTILSLAYTLPNLAERLLGGNDISYGVYLYHGLVINVLVQSGIVPPAAQMPVLFGVALLLGLLSWRLIERPAIRLKGRAVRPIAVATT
jgi:peptidoglycan/LPS O-acetylase OafA/YrhL